MTMRDFADVGCLRCGTRQSSLIFRTINVRVDPQLKNDLLNGSINRFHCTKCGSESSLPIDLLYHDPDQGFWVQYLPFNWRERDGQWLSRFTRDGEMRVGGSSELGEPYKRFIDACATRSQTSYVARSPHIVFSMDELVRYVVFRDRLFHLASAAGASCG
jgi:hypothetical protein